MKHGKRRAVKRRFGHNGWTEPAKKFLRATLVEAIAITAKNSGQRTNAAAKATIVWRRDRTQSGQADREAFIVKLQPAGARPDRALLGDAGETIEQTRGVEAGDGDVDKAVQCAIAEAVPILTAHGGQFGQDDQRLQCKIMIVQGAPATAQLKRQHAVRCHICSRVVHDTTGLAPVLFAVRRVTDGT